VLRNARRALATAAGRRAGRLRRAVNDLAASINVTTVVVAQARSRLAGVMPDSATRIVSLHDHDARPIVRGRRGRPVEFGCEAQIIDNTDGVIVDHTIEQGNAADAPQLGTGHRPHHRRAGRPPRAVTTDRGYGEPRVETDLRALGVRTLVIPSKGPPPPAQPGKPSNTDHPSDLNETGIARARRHDGSNSLKVLGLRAGTSS